MVAKELTFKGIGANAATLGYETINVRVWEAGNKRRAYVSAIKKLGTSPIKVMWIDLNTGDAEAERTAAGRAALWSTSESILKVNGVDWEKDIYEVLK